MPCSETRPFFLGIDAVEFKKARKFYRTHRSRLTEFFTPKEVSFIEKNDKKDENLATLLAAKEAVFKAQGSAWMGPAGFQTIEVVNNDKKIGFKDWTMSVIRKKHLVIVHCLGLRD